jgi:hypothetical protein
MKPFKALSDAAPKQMEMVVIDIGYSSKARSCGVASSSGVVAKKLRFGDAVNEVAKRLRDCEKDPLLVIEAPLSMYHDDHCKPGRRGEFEKGRAWYYGAGAVTCLAAIRLLEKLATHETFKGRLKRRVFLAESFLSNKTKRTDHSDDAQAILDPFWKVEPAMFHKDVEPSSRLVEGVPPIRVFDSPA